MSDYFNLNDYPKEIKEKTSRFKKIHLNFNKKILLLILIAVVGIPFTVILALQNQDNRQYASTVSNQVKLSDIEIKVAGIEPNGKLNEERSEDMAMINPKGYELLKKQGQITNSEEIEKEIQASEKQTIRASSIIPASIIDPNITSCGEITNSGNYTVVQDITQQDDTCLNIHDTTDVNIDCNNHLVKSQTDKSWWTSTISLENVQNFSIKNCSIESRSTANNGSNALSIQVTRSNNGNIINNKFLNGFIDVASSDHLDFNTNEIFGFYQQNNSSFNIFQNNRIIADPADLSAAIWISNDGHNNTIKDNNMDGGWDGVNHASWEEYRGADDGIALGFEKEDYISGNIIKNNWDCGIESSNLIQNTQIINNQIINSGFCGIGAWYWNSWLNNNISSNIIDKANYAFFLFRAYGLDENHNEQTVIFKDNNFSDNIFKNRTSSSYVGSAQPYSAYVNFANIQLPTQLGNNTFKNNDFDISVLEPVINPASVIVDQGGNKCLSFQDDYSRPLTCVGSKVNKIIVYPIADAFVRKDQPTKNFGTLAYLQTNDSPTAVSYLKFNLSSLAGKKIIGAEINFKVKNPSGYNQYLKRVEDVPWKENQINFNNRPRFVANISSFSAVVPNQVIKLSVFNAVKSSQGKNLILGIQSNDDKAGSYFSRESASKPKLIIQYTD